MNITPTILGIDASSVMLGYCLYNGAVIASGEVALHNPDIAERCRLAFAQLNGLLALYDLYRPDCIAIESPVARFARALIPQCRVSGALMVAASIQGLLVIEVTPTAAKRALTAHGNASKELMQAVAWQRNGVRGEHAADALGVALASVKLVSVERQAA